MKTAISLFLTAILLLFCCSPGLAPAAYHHMGESDTPKFLQAYPNKAGTKLDNCVLCHRGGSYSQANGKKVDLGSCQWCHHTFGYDGKGDINDTLNRFGKEYRANGRNVPAFKAIETHDSDGDTFSNIDEISAVRYPGDPKDDPTKVVAPFRIFTREQLLAMPQHSQFLLLNTAKAVDSYAEFSGVTVEYLLGKAGMDSSATRITAYSPDGYAQGHPLEFDGSGDPYVKGAYPAATFYYDKAADKDSNSLGWCDYHSPGAKGLKHGTPIRVQDGLRLLLALRSEGKDLLPGSLGPDNALQRNCRGPFWVVAPQKSAGPPDQPSTRSRNDVIWPYDQNLDHNGGASTKCATVIKVDPLPAGTTDIDVTEAGWAFIEQKKIIIYGSLQGPKLVAPENGATGIPWNPAHFTWEKSPGIKSDEVTAYQLEYTKDDTSDGRWESISVSNGKTSTRHTGTRRAGFALFATCGILTAVRTRGFRWGMVIILLLELSGTALVSHAGNETSKTIDASPVELKTTLVLQPDTTYYWRVRDRDKNGGTTVSEVHYFTTGK